MIKVTYCCDRCKAEQDKPEQFWEIGIITKSAGAGWPYSTPTQKIQLCRLCIEYFGIVPYVKTPVEQQVPPPTLEDMIVEIVTNAITNAQS